MTPHSHQYIKISDVVLLDIMLPENRIKEGLSKSYLRAVANVAGYKVQFLEDDFGIDAIMSSVEERPTGRISSGVNLEIQLKSTTLASVQETESHYAYELKNKNYNDLVQPGLLTPRILVLLILPNEKEDWLTHSVEMLILRNCAYWTYLAGKPGKPIEDSTTTIHINRTRTFCPNSLKEIMETIKTNGDLNGL